MADIAITKVVNTPSSEIANLTGNNAWTGNQTHAGTETFAGAVHIDGATEFDGTVQVDGATTLNGALSGTSVKDEDNMASDSATAVPTQQSVKAYTDLRVLKAGDTMTGDLKIHADDKELYLGAGDDMSIGYTGTVGEIKTDIVAASDLNIGCGTDKTIVLTETVYNDANVGSLVLVTGGTLPGVVEILDNTGAGTGVYSRGFAINEQGSGSIEIPHDYKEGTDLVFHVHWTGQDAPSGTDNVKWQVAYTITRSGSTTPPITTDSAETAIDTQYKWYFTNVETITGTNLKIGDQVNFTITRIAAVGDAYAGEAVVATMGFHYECDTLGSRQIGTK